LTHQAPSACSSFWVIPNLLEPQIGYLNYFRLGSFSLRQVSDSSTCSHELGAARPHAPVRTSGLSSQATGLTVRMAEHSLRCSSGPPAGTSASRSRWHPQASLARLGRRVSCCSRPNSRRHSLLSSLAPQHRLARPANRLNQSWATSLVHLVYWSAPRAVELSCRTFAAMSRKRQPESWQHCRFAACNARPRALGHMTGEVEHEDANWVGRLGRTTLEKKCITASRTQRQPG
jgi:hypothetical protein